MLCLNRRQVWGIQNINIYFPNILVENLHIYHNKNEKCIKQREKKRQVNPSFVCNLFLLYDVTII